MRTSVEEMSMKMRRMLVRFQTTIINIGLVLGFNTFYYSRKHKSFINSKWLFIYCKFIAFAFFLAYPIALLLYFYEENIIPVSVTDYARLSLSITNWLQCFAIYLNQASNSSSICDVYNDTMALHHRYVTTFKMNVEFVNDLQLKSMKKCALRLLILLPGFIAINHVKYWRPETSIDTVFEFILFSYLFLPSIIITFASNRLYTAATCCLYFIRIGNENLRNIEATCREFIDLRDVSVLQWEFRTYVDDEILMSLRNHTALHQIFIKYHKLNAKYIIFIIGYCILNVIFELFFLYLNISLSIQDSLNLSTHFVFLSCAQTFLYMYEFISIIFIYNKLKMESDESTSILQQISMLCHSAMKYSKISSQIETYSIQLMHCMFDVTICGLFTVNKSMLFSIISSMTTYLILIIQFRVEEASSAIDPEESKFISRMDHLLNKTFNGSDIE